MLCLPNQWRRLGRPHEGGEDGDALLAGLDKDIKQLSGKLANEKFVANAPQKIIDENRDRLAESEAKRGKVVEALERVRSFG